MLNPGEQFSAICIEPVQRGLGPTDTKTLEKSESTLSMSSSPKVRGRFCSFKKDGCSPLTSRQMSSKTR